MRVFTRFLLLFVLAGAARAELPDGAALFAQNCAMCHQNGAVGLAGQFPRLAGRVGPISGKPAGRAYLIGILTYGLSGQVTVDKQPIIGVMPPFAALGNEEVAAILNYLQGLGHPSKQPYSGDEVAKGRAGSLTAGTMMAERQKLVGAKVIE